MLCLSLGPGVRRFSLIFVLLSLSNIAASQPQSSTAVEKRALSELVQGNPGDFSDKARVVDEDFLEKLLSGGFKDVDRAHNLDLHGVTISNAIFQDPVNINFDVPYRVTFDHCEFRQGIDLSGSQFAKDLVFNASSFGTSQAGAGSDAGNGVEFINASVAGTVVFTNPEFYIPVDFTKARLRELNIINATFASPSADDPDLDLTALHVDNDLSLSVNSAQPRQVVAQFLVVNGSTSFGRSGVGFFATKELDLTNSRFQNLAFYGFSQWQANPSAGAVSLDGFSFQEVTLHDCGNSQHCGAWKMLDLLDSEQVNYSPQPYLAMEQNLGANGDVSRADDAYIRMRNRQRHQRIVNPRNVTAAWIEWFGDTVLYQLIGYGREPGRAVWFAVGFVAIGMIIFRPKHMVAQESGNDDKSDKHDPDKSQKTYSSFWYSLDVLAPAIELGADSAWEPDPNWWIGRTYSYWHRIAGWILVPLILAAITGFIH